MTADEKLSFMAGCDAGKNWAAKHQDIPKLQSLRKFAAEQAQERGRVGLHVEGAYPYADRAFFALDGSDDGNEDPRAAAGFWEHALFGYDSDAVEDENFMRGFVSGAIRYYDVCSLGPAKAAQ